MRKHWLIVTVLAALACAGAAQARPHHARMVAYDAKDKRFYSVAWARAHGMHDRGGDPLTIVRRSSLPPDAKMSRAMKGRAF